MFRSETGGTEDSWIDSEPLIPQLKSRPYLVAPSDRAAVVGALADKGFRTVSVTVDGAGEKVEGSLIAELVRALGLANTSSWVGYNDRMWDHWAAEDEPVAVIVHGLDGYLRADLHGFVACVLRLLSMSGGSAAVDGFSYLMVEYVFIGSWEPGWSSHTSSQDGGIPLK